MSFTTINGTPGNDALPAAPTAGALKIFGLAGNDTLTGGSDADSLTGGDGNDRIVGGAGNDTMLGNAGSDTLIGGDGVDIVRGGFGADHLTGGAGNDRFQFFKNEVAGSYDLVTGVGGDVIFDFTGAGAPGGDQVELYGFTGGTLTFENYSVHSARIQNYILSDSSGFHTKISIVTETASGPQLLAGFDYVFR